MPPALDPMQAMLEAIASATTIPGPLSSSMLINHSGVDKQVGVGHEESNVTAGESTHKMNAVATLIRRGRRLKLSAKRTVARDNEMCLRAIGQNSGSFHYENVKTLTGIKRPTAAMTVAFAARPSREQMIPAG